jgi:hypothetical protein
VTRGFDEATGIGSPRMASLMSWAGDHTRHHRLAPAS